MIEKDWEETGFGKEMAGVVSSICIVETTVRRKDPRPIIEGHSSYYSELGH